jgi:hypothetical protein
MATKKFVFDSLEDCEKFLENLHKEEIEKIENSESKPSENNNVLTDLKIMDNGRGANDKLNIGVRMRHYKDPQPNRWHVHVQSYGEILTAGTYDQENISHMGVIAIEQSFYYSEKIKGKWVYVPNFNARVAPAGKYFKNVIASWVAAKRDNGNDEMIVEGDLGDL